MFIVHSVRFCNPFKRAIDFTCTIVPSKYIFVLLYYHYYLNVLSHTTTTHDKMDETGDFRIRRVVFVHFVPKGVCVAYNSYVPSLYLEPITNFFLYLFQDISLTATIASDIVLLVIRVAQVPSVK